MAQICLSEDVNIENIKELHRAITAALETESEIILDFSRVRTVDNSLRLVLITTCRRARKRNIELSMLNMPDPISRILGINGPASGTATWNTR